MFAENHLLKRLVLWQSNFFSKEKDFNRSAKAQFAFKFINQNNQIKERTMAIDIRTIDWGVGDSKQELKFGSQKFAARFVLLDDLKMVNEKHHLFIWGGRGCGKSALSWKLSQGIKKDIVLFIDFEEDGDESAWVQNTLSRLNHLSKIPNFPTLKFISEAWYHSMLVEIMRQLIKRRLIGRLAGRDTLIRYVKKNNIQNKKLLETLTLMCEKADKVLNKTPDPMVQGALITAKGLLALESYMTKNTDFKKAKNAVLDFFSKPDSPNIHIIVDSVDKWLLGNWHPKAESEYLTLCSAVRGLTKALLKIHLEPKLEPKTIIKALLPRDMKDHIHDRATRHETIYHHYMRWSAKELLAFIVKRINEKANDCYMDIWLEIFPDTIENHDTKVKHSSFDYLLRHSQYKPRELLLCCRRISEYARKGNKSHITKKEFAKIIHEHATEE